MGQGQEVHARRLLQQCQTQVMLEVHGEQCCVLCS